MILCDSLKYKISRLFKSPNSVGMCPPNEFPPSAHVKRKNSSFALNHGNKCVAFLT